jgi:hypothetical protein
VRVLPADDDRWEKIARAGLGKRLNLPDGDAALERWREHCTLYELTPRFREVDEAGGSARPAGTSAAAPAAAAGTTDAQAAAAGEEKPKAKPAEEDIHVEVEVDQEVYDQLIAEGKSERIARAKAKAAYVRAEKARIRAEREGAA